MQLESCAATCVENPRVGGSIPPQATKIKNRCPRKGQRFFTVAYHRRMRTRWILYLVLSLMIGRAWGLHLPSMAGQDAPCHGQAAHERHAIAQADEAVTSSDPSPYAAVPSAFAPADAMQGDGHVCCLILANVQDWRWSAGLVPTPNRSEPAWTSANRSLDLRPPISRL